MLSHGSLVGPFMVSFEVWHFGQKEELLSTFSAPRELCTFACWIHEDSDTCCVETSRYKSLIIAVTLRPNIKPLKTVLSAFESAHLQHPYEYSVGAALHLTEIPIRSCGKPIKFFCSWSLLFYKLERCRVFRTLLSHLMKLCHLLELNSNTSFQLDPMELMFLQKGCQLFKNIRVYWTVMYHLIYSIRK